MPSPVDVDTRPPRVRDRLATVPHPLRSAIGGPAWQRISSGVTVVMVGAAVVLGIGIGLSGPAVSPVSPPLAEAATGTADSTTDAGTDDLGAEGADQGGPGGDRGADGGRRDRRR